LAGYFAPLGSWPPEPPLDCLITAMHGREDRSGQQELIEEGPSAAEFSFAEFAGEPFFTNTAQTEVLAPVRRTFGWVIRQALMG